MDIFAGFVPGGWVFLVAYWTVLVAELVGDKTLYTVASLATRFQPVLVLIGASAAFAAKMALAVLLGNALLRASARWTMLLSAGVFFSMAVLAWRKRAPEEREEVPVPIRWSEAVAASFAALFFTEWGDPGQFSAAALAANLHEPIAIWLGSTLALVSKAVFAITVGSRLRQLLSERAMRTVASASYGAMGLIALYEAILPR